MASDTVKATSTDHSPHHLLWMDGVGGFLLCLNTRVTVGQAFQEPLPTIPILADIARKHAVLERDNEGYILEGVEPVQFQAKEIRRTALHNGDRFTLGSSCQLRFWQSVPVSRSARLEIVSGHRLLFPVEHILLMADTLIFGGAQAAHVPVSDWEKPLIVMRTKTGLGLHYSGNMMVGAERFTDKAPLEPGKTVFLGNLAVTLEHWQPPARNAK